MAHISDPLTPELQVAKHHTYAIAWGLIRLAEGHTQEAARQRVGYKKFVRLYAAHRGWSAFLVFSSGDGIGDMWEIKKWHRADRATVHRASLSDVCQAIVADDMREQGVELETTVEE